VITNLENIFYNVGMTRSGVMKCDEKHQMSLLYFHSLVLQKDMVGDLPFCHKRVK